MPDRSPSEWARICRVQAATTTNEETRLQLIEMALEYEAQAAARGSTSSGPNDDQLRGRPVPASDQGTPLAAQRAAEIRNREQP